MTSDQVSEKAIGSYKAKFKTKFDKRKNDNILLSISISEDLRKVLKESTIDELANFSYNDGDSYRNSQRYKVKRWVYSALYDDRRDIIFSKKLVDDGELDLTFNSVSMIDPAINGIKETVRQLIQTVLKYSSIDMTVNFNVEK